jgi:hypothetical protein
MIYNANLDKSLSQRTSVAELRAELKRWEELQRVNAKKRDRDMEVGEDLIGYQVRTRFRFTVVFFYSIFSFAKLMASDIVMPY